MCARMNVNVRARECMLAHARALHADELAHVPISGGTHTHTSMYTPTKLYKAGLVAHICGCVQHACRSAWLGRNARIRWSMLHQPMHFRCKSTQERARRLCPCCCAEQPWEASWIMDMQGLLNQRHEACTLHT